jgi:hypothetical protein
MTTTKANETELLAETPRRAYFSNPRGRMLLEASARLTLREEIDGTFRP